MVRNVVLTLLLGIVLALQGVAGCEPAHAEPGVAAAGHCDEMAMNADSGQDMGAKHDAPSPDADSCAKMCHLAVAQSATPVLIPVEMRAAVPAARPLDNLAGDSIRPATPPPKMI
ncbi:MAG: hypothetical protein IPM67_10670 [Sphingomonadales bacterium]|nr:hypothetical protein [Sphingomonadales bacterium]MBK9269085.1 hypothetical protein [Sphingomonadales bacterium]